MLLYSANPNVYTYSQKIALSSNSAVDIDGYTNIVFKLSQRANEGYGSNYLIFASTVQRNIQIATAYPAPCLFLNINSLGDVDDITYSVSVEDVITSVGNSVYICAAIEKTAQRGGASVQSLEFSEIYLER